MDMHKITKAARKVLPLKYCGAVILAAGTASRMGGIDKMFADLGGKPVIYRTAEAFSCCDAISEIVVVTRPDKIMEVTGLLGEFPKVKAVMAGGETRQASVAAGLAALSKKVKLAAVQDGARPLVTPLLIDRVVRAAHTYGAAAPGVPVKDTVKVVRGGIVESTPDRSSLKAIQTPQVFDRDLLCGALVKAQQDGAAVTDDCSAVERLGMSVRIVEGDEQNMKITTAADLKIARLLWEEQK